MKNFAITAFVLLLIGAGVFAVLGAQSRAGSTPGLVDGRLQACGERPNCVSSRAPKGSDHYVAPFTIPPDAEDAAWARLVESVAASGGTVTRNGDGYLAATFTSRVFGFVDDFECRLQPGSGVINVRSAARVGYSDLNVNRERVERIRTLLDEAA